ncbi:MAG: prepilin-type N-terminal cleavage/methylation domain-containing protein [Planctomycetaceae bacterium]|nr:prepilin-type N-terminal cleavage/methylation domain-containing protein [Planctomycetaceae bacterium]
MTHATRYRAAYSLIELSTVVAVMAILAAVAMPLVTPTGIERLESVARYVVEDLNYARSLAVTNNSLYRLTFDTTNNLYYIEHSGTNSALNTLPKLVTRSGNDTATRQYTYLARLVASNNSIRLVTVRSATNSPLTQLEFRTFGETTQTTATTIWLAYGVGTAARYIPVQVNPVTGLASMGSITSVAPTTTATSSGS